MKLEISDEAAKEMLDDAHGIDDEWGVGLPDWHDIVWRQVARCPRCGEWTERGTA